MTDTQTTQTRCTEQWCRDNPKLAAAEIERLRAENAALIHDNATLYEGWTAECNK